MNSASLRFIPLDQLEAVARADLARNQAAVKQACATFAPRKSIEACFAKMNAHKPRVGPVEEAREQIPGLTAFVREKDLVTIPGVARKTANVVLFGAFGINEGLAVDTHVKRIAYRLGLTDETDPVPIERDLMNLFPREEWGDVNHRMVWFGREVCDARKPLCDACEMRSFCPRREPPKAVKPAGRRK